jgi:hypothetical protein
LPTNIGTRTNSEFTVVPELTLNAGYEFKPGVRAFVGFNLLYWSNVVRPGDQIDRGIDVSFIPNAPMGIPATNQIRPAPVIVDSDLWLLGLNFGLEFRW